jgi:hypothetical protein
MRKERTVPSISKPMIDEKKALEFASIGSSPTPASGTKQSANKPSLQAALKEHSYEDIGKGMRQISIIIKKSLYERIAKDAARKDRTIEEHLKRHLSKYYGK